MQNRTQPPAPPITIAFVLFGRFSNLCLANCLEPMRAANAFARAPAYRWRFVTLDGAPVVSSSDMPVLPDGDLDSLGAVDRLFVLASYDHLAHDTGRTRRLLARAARRCDLVVGLDAGAWLMASAGLLRGRRATIHRDLYQTNETGLVDVGHLVREVVTQTVEITPGIDDLEVTIDVEPIWLYPDQAVPMSLLASEAVINALKHMPGAEAHEGRRWLTVTLTQDEDRTCTFRAENVATQRPPQDNVMRGMGRKLIKAFATQLAAKVGTEETEDRYVLQVIFTASEFAPAPGTATPRRIQ